MSPLTFAPPSRAEVAEEAGLSEHKTRVAVHIANIPEEEFETAVESHTPPGTTLLAKVEQRYSPERVRSVTQESLAAIVKSVAAGRAIEGLLLFEKCATECGVEPIVEILRSRGHYKHLEHAKRGVALAFRLNHALDEAGGRGNPMLRPVPEPESGA
jgi:(2Fe-2S) ferredoxin